MKWLEMFELRCDNKKKTLVEKELIHLVKEIIAKEKTYKIKFYKNRTVDTNFIIHLRHNIILNDDCISPVGEQVLSTLKEFGLVNHSTWMAKNQ